MATSGTVATTVFTTRQLIDHAFRRCRLAPQQVTAEHLLTARELLWLQLQTLNGRGILLHAVETQLLGLNEGVASLLADVGTLDVLHVNLRTVTRLANSLVTVAGLGGSLTATLSTATQVKTLGLLPSIAGTWGFTIQTSTDGTVWKTAATEPGVAAVVGKWLWYDIQGATNALAIRVVAGSSTTLGVSDMAVANTPQDIPLSPINRDNYDALPNKSFAGRPVQYWFDRQRGAPTLTLWPAPSSAFTASTLVVVRAQRQLMDVGSLQQEIEVPGRWYLPVIADLARNLAAEIKEVDVSLIPQLEEKAEALITQAWNGESDGAPVQLLPNLRAYRA